MRPNRRSRPLYLVSRLLSNGSVRISNPILSQVEEILDQLGRAPELLSDDDSSYEGDASDGGSLARRRGGYGSSGSLSVDAVGGGEGGDGLHGAIASVSDPDAADAAAAEAADVVAEADAELGEFSAGMYNSLRNNCNHFSDAFCRLLMPHGSGIPYWVNRAAWCVPRDMCSARRCAR